MEIKTTRARMRMTCGVCVYSQIRLNIKDGKTGKVASETMTIDRGRNIIEYHLKDEDLEQWVLHDFNKVCQRFYY